MGTKTHLNHRRIFSEAIRKQTVQDIEKGRLNPTEASRETGASLATIYKWLYKYSRYLKKNQILVVEEKSEAYRSKELERQLKEAQAALGRKQMELDYLNKLIELANAQLGMDLKKNFATPPSVGSGKTKESGTDTK